MRAEIIVQIYNMEKRSQRQRLFVGGAIFILGLMLALSPHISGGRGSIFWLMAGGLFMIIALLFILHTQHLFPFRGRTVAQWLQEEPETIVWVYPYIVENMPFGIKLFNMTTVYLNLLDGDKLQLSCTPAEANHLIDQLRTALPHASFGYSQEKEIMYANDPKMLLRDAHQ